MSFEGLLTQVPNKAVIFTGQGARRRRQDSLMSLTAGTKLGRYEIRAKLTTIHSIDFEPLRSVLGSSAC